MRATKKQLQKAVENAEVAGIPYDMAHEEVHRQMDMFYNNLKPDKV